MATKYKYDDCEHCKKIQKFGVGIPHETLFFCSKLCAFNWAMDQDISKEPFGSIEVPLGNSLGDALEAIKMESEPVEKTETP